jgi:hypothetical protein
MVQVPCPSAGTASPVGSRTDRVMAFVRALLTL